MHWKTRYDNHTSLSMFFVIFIYLMLVSKRNLILHRSCKYLYLCPPTLGSHISLLFICVKDPNTALQAVIEVCLFAADPDIQVYSIFLSAVMAACFTLQCNNTLWHISGCLQRRSEKKKQQQINKCLSGAAFTVGYKWHVTHHVIHPSLAYGLYFETGCRKL